MVRVTSEKASLIRRDCRSLSGLLLIFELHNISDYLSDGFKMFLRNSLVEFG